MADAQDALQNSRPFVGTPDSRDESVRNSSNLEGSNHWRLLGSNLPKQEIVFFCQVLIIYIVVITCVANLTLGRDEGKIWIALLSSCLGYLLPNPSLKTSRHEQR